MTRAIMEGLLEKVLISSNMNAITYTTYNHGFYMLTQVWYAQQ